MTGWYLYLIRTASGSLYTGITTDVPRRFSEHQANGVRCARSLRGKGPLVMAFSCPVGDRSAALSLEWKIKRWPRQRKEALIRGDIAIELSDAE